MAGSFWSGSGSVLHRDGLARSMIFASIRLRSGQVLQSGGDGLRVAKVPSRFKNALYRTNLRREICPLPDFFLEFLPAIAYNLLIWRSGMELAYFPIAFL